MIALASFAEIGPYSPTERETRKQSRQTHTPPALTAPATVLVEKLNCIFQTDRQRVFSLECTLARTQEGTVQIALALSCNILACLVALASTITTSHAQVSRRYQSMLVSPPLLIHHCESCHYNTPIPESSGSWQQEHTCSHVRLGHLIRLHFQRTIL